MKKDTWVSLWKPEFASEAALIYDALNEIYEKACSQPEVCAKKFISKTQMLMFIIGILTFDKFGIPLIVKILGLGL